MLILSFFASAVAIALTPPKPSLPAPNGVVVLDGVQTAVHWDDGDTFFAPGTKIKARLNGYNTLESYGAVHRFGPGEAALFEISEQATVLARSQSWHCTIQPGSGGYGRKSVDCPDLKQALLEQGLAHVFAVDEPADSKDIAAQQRAMSEKLGMWSQGVPKGLITSVHSIDEKPNQKESYNRVVDLTTGLAPKRKHQNTYSSCEWVCMEGSCLLYVPYGQRYGSQKASCLKDAE